MSSHIAHQTSRVQARPSDSPFGESAPGTSGQGLTGQGMTGQAELSAVQVTVGETLPLFDHVSVGSDSARQSLRGPNLRGPRVVSDRHMHVAWELSKALKAVKSGRKANRQGIQLPPKLTARQRHKVGNAICEHLLASLRQQVDSEQQISEH